MLVMLQYDRNPLVDCFAEARRKTEIPTKRPDGLTSAFASDLTKQQQLAAFVEEVAVNPGPPVYVIEALASFLLPHAEKARNLHMKR